MSINAWDINVSMLFSLLLANGKSEILSCFLLLFLVVLSNFFTIPVVREKIKVKFALAIPTGAPAMLVNERIDTPPVVALKAIKSCLWNEKQLHICLIFYCMIFFD